MIGGLVSEVSGGKFANGAVTGAFVYMFNHALENKKNLDWDLDGNGKMSLSEANNWWKNGNGQPVDIDASKLTVLDYENYDVVDGIGDYLVHGGISLKTDGSIHTSWYDFDIKISSNFFIGIRNAGTVLGALHAGPGTRFQTRFFAKPKIIKNINWKVRGNY